MILGIFSENIIEFVSRLVIQSLIFVVTWSNLLPFNSFRELFHDFFETRTNG